MQCHFTTALQPNILPSMRNNTTPLLHITVLKCLSPFKIQMLHHKLFLSGFVKTKLNLLVLKVFYESQPNLMFSKKCGFRSWRGWNIQTLFFWKPTPLKTLPEWNNLSRLCNKWSSCLPVRLSKNKGLSLLTGGQYAQNRVGERRMFSPLIFQWQGHFM